jgi:hypothetical protein
MQIRELSCKTLQIPMKTTKPQKREKNQKKNGKNHQKNATLKVKAQCTAKSSQEPYLK